MTPEHDTPRAAFNLLSWRANVVVVVSLVALSLIAWQSTLDQANSMSGMVMGVGQIGYRNQGSMGAVVFLTMWVTMMAAMMLPTVAPMVLAHHAVARQRGEGAISTIAFVASSWPAPTSSPSGRRSASTSAKVRLRLSRCMISVAAWATRFAPAASTACYASAAAGR
jgi:predicted metal-binding membrane protein